MKWLLHTLVGRLTLALMTAIVLLAIAVSIILAFARANHAGREAQAQCQLDHDVANAPIVTSGPAKTSPLGLQLSAGARIAYYGADCQLGPLLPPDNAILFLLPRQLGGTKN